MLVFQIAAGIVAAVILLETGTWIFLPIIYFVYAFPVAAILAFTIFILLKLIIGAWRYVRKLKSQHTLKSLYGKSYVGNLPFPLPITAIISALVRYLLKLLYRSAVRIPLVHQPLKSFAHKIGPVISSDELWRVIQRSIWWFLGIGLAMIMLMALMAVIQQA